jgi:uncharacterized protein YraI
MTRLIEGPLGWLITLLVIPALIVVVLLLPPVNLLDRLQIFTYTRIGVNGGAVVDPDGATVSFPAEGIQSTFLADIQSIPRSDFLAGQVSQSLYEAAQQLPEYLQAKSPFYQVDVRGSSPDEVILTIPIPNESTPYETLSLYSWVGDAWVHVPNLVLAADDRIEARLDYVPANFLVVQTSPPVPSVTADLGIGGQLPTDARVSAFVQAGLYLRGDGALDGLAPENTDATLPVIRNWEGDGATVKVVRTDLINNLLLDPGQQENQLNAIDQVIIQKNYAGIVIDYRGIDATPSARADFAHLIGKLADRLHAAGRTLAVRVEPASPVSAEEWDTKGYDWRALGGVVDKLIVPAPLDPRAYEPGGEMEALLTFAASEVDRRKLKVELPGYSIEQSGPYLLLKGYQEALRPLLGEVQADTGGSNGEVALNLESPQLLERLKLNEATGVYSYKYQDGQGQERTVYLENARSISQKLKLLKKYNITDVSLQAASDIDPNIWGILLQFQEGAELSVGEGRMSVAYTVYASDGSVLTNNVRTLEDPRFVFAPPGGGDLRVEAQLIGDRGEALTAPLSMMLALGKALGANEAPKEAAQAAPVEKAAEAPAPKIVTSQLLNVRGGPGTNYTILGQITPGSSYNIVAKNPAGDWWKVDIGDGVSGWVIGQLVSTSGDASAVAVSEDIPEPVASAAVATDQPAAQEEKPAAAPQQPAAQAVSAPPPSGGVAFGYGVQGHMVDTGMAGQVMGMTKNMGFNWVKQQIPWIRFEGSPGAIDYGTLDDLINNANAHGVNLLFSIVKSPHWAREPGFVGEVEGPPQDPQTYARFVGAVAGKYCGGPLKAIEVWNEQNLHYEWGNKPLNPGDYMALLVPSYAAIKAACPSMYVISGALTPAGSNPGKAVDDFDYLRGMFQAGLANYADGIGAHPSGYNVPPSVTWQDACVAIQKSGNSFNGACDSPHHSWSFRSTMEGYWGIMNEFGAGNKKIWPTEFGWAAGGALHPAYKYADDNSYDEQAQWTVEAYQMMRNWGYVGPAILWNMNFRVTNPGTELAQWGIVDQGWGPLPIYNALASMAK